MNGEITETAYGRIGLLGNPSDMYGGKCISFTFNNLARVSVVDSERFEIIGSDDGEKPDDINYTGSHKLIKATIRYLKEFGLEEGIGVSPIRIVYDSNIPLGSGLAGSSAIIIAALRVFNKRYGLEMDRYQIAETALHVETDELGISAGFQDRYAISFEGMNHLDFTGKEYMKKHPDDEYGKVRRLDVKGIPFFLCLGVQPKSSAIVHNPLREEFLRGGLRAKEIKSHMDNIAELADRGVEPLLGRDWSKLGELMNENTLLRDKYNLTLSKDRELIRASLAYGALGAKVAGSGGAIVVLTDEGDSRGVFDKMIRNPYPCMKPEVVG